MRLLRILLFFAILYLASRLALGDWLADFPIPKDGR